MTQHSIKVEKHDKRMVRATIQATLLPITCGRVDGKSTPEVERGLSAAAPAVHCDT
jgi:hypothetical protein